MAIDTVDNSRKWAVISTQVANPAAGADWSITVPAGSIWRVLVIRAVLTASATVATRVPILQVKDAAGNTIFDVPPAATLAAGGGANMNWSAGANSIVSNNSRFMQGLPMGMILPEGAVISSSTVAIQTGDQWSAINLLVEQAYAL